jgi:hypothetical protein
MNHNIRRGGITDGPLATARLRAMQAIAHRGMSDAEWMERAKAIQQSVLRYHDVDMDAMMRLAAYQYIADRNKLLEAQAAARPTLVQRVRTWWKRVWG